MGRWGEFLFEGDNDLETAMDISRDAGIELYHYEICDDPELPFTGLGLETTRDHLNNGILKRLFDQFTTRNPTYEIESGGLRVVFLG